MSLQTYVLEDDQWVARTVSADELLRENTTARRKTGRQSLSKPPTYGLLTKTIVESPVIRWVLPVQLRSARYNDVALIGDNCVQICELGPDRQLKDVIRKKDFGSRIRNAVVMGSPQYTRKANEGNEDGTHVKTEDSDTEMADMNNAIPGFRCENPRLPPQLLVLMLERGDLVFIFLQQGPNGRWSFVSSTHRVPGERLVSPGWHMAIDPSSNYLVIGCTENIFIVYQLESMENLQHQYLEGGTLHPIKDWEARHVIGIIHKIEFLHPIYGNEIQVILMIIMVQPEVSKLTVYEWDCTSTSDWKKALREEKSGHRLDDEYRMPLLVVPLKVRYAFLIITESITATCSNVLGGPPTFVQFELANCDNTQLHHGMGDPLWTAWTRPIRHPPYHSQKDVIYLAREDGLINFLECGDESEIETSVSMGSVDCNIDTAFASLFHLFGDILVTGGDSGPGAVWNVQARQSPQRIGSIPNWSPTVDFVVTVEGTLDESSDGSSSDIGQMSLCQPDKVFSCSGRGITGAVTQFRYGIQARIGLDLTYSSNVKQCWAISNYDGDEEDGFFLLLALPSGSSILHLSRDLSEASEKDHDATPYDLTSTTLTAQDADGVAVQVTANYITVATPTGCSQNSTSEILRDYNAVVTDAAIEGNMIALAVYSGSDFKIALLKISGLEVSLNQAFDVEGEVTCLTIGKFIGKTVVLAGFYQDKDPILSIYPAELGQEASATPISLRLQPSAISLSHELVTDSMGPSPFGALTSIAYFGERSNKAVVVAGTKFGDVLTIQLDQSQPGDYGIYRDKFNVSQSRVYSGAAVGDPNSILVCSDTELAMMTNYVSLREGRFEEIYRVWPTDGDRPSMASPPINSVASLREQLPEFGDSTMVMISGPRIMITEFQRQPKPVPRYFPIGGTPVKILYSKRLGALVTVVSKDGLPSLHFIDPETGDDLSLPLERKKIGEAYNYHEVEYITGLGNIETRVMSLATWTYRNGNVRGDWIVLAMRRKENEGLLLIISAEREKASTDTNVFRPVRFWTKFDRKIKDGPIWSVATDEQGVFLCVGYTIQYHQIEGGRFRITRQHELPSPASWMEVVNGHLHALTTHHSLVIFDYRRTFAEGGEQMIQLHTDEICRHSLHAIELGTHAVPITLLSDPMCGVHGLWAPDEEERPLCLVFQAELQASIRKFARGFTRAAWGSVKNRPRYGCVITGLPGSDIIGLTIDGSLQHFSLLNEDAWRLLRFIQNLAVSFPATRLRSSLDDPLSPAVAAVVELDMEPDLFPKSNTHIDGDILRICLDRRALEGLVSNSKYLQRFRELLKPLDEDGYLSSEGISSDGSYFELAYSILKYYLSPVLS
ncbi:uncharacterized protein GGS22DRAFT_62226 [Annulohypoxylon maeteangense]|uniref:uncharacterized protein n=1 Tax=Annulohypoxylon maeteangense TaxID=1927788 RepID=UPI002007681D|nr:uncharacterized protein GGS22DRAFT_62226 [Annulohypoxylon maeteangense]KAI0888688.1 hypothetical protein GGS22DRAFT_62226 [Annulohypoxylon maeteangense]